MRLAISPLAMGLFSAFKDITNSYSPLESWAFDRFATFMAAPLHEYAMIQLAALVRPNMRVLDVGCGGGQFAIALAQRFDTLEIVGVDLSPEQIARAQARARDASLAQRLRFIEANAIDLPFDDGEFDLVYSVGSIKHWPEPARGLRECARVLRPGALLWVMEGDRGGRPQDHHALISSWKVPAPLRVLAGAFFRHLVAGHSLDLAEAQALLMTLSKASILEGTAERGAGLPIWVIAGSRG